MKPIISPSILSADFGYLARDLEMINRSEAEWVHIDIMDGVFVPNISFGFPVLKYVAKLTDKPLDVHLMIVNPEKFIPEVKALGAHTMNVHYEACTHLHRVIQQIKEAGMQPAVTINPATPVALLQDIIQDVVCQQADFETENADEINSILSSYSINGVSAQFGSSWNIFTDKGVAMKRDLYALLCQTGLCCRLAR